jgi:hypothetical protein
VLHWTGDNMRTAEGLDAATRRVDIFTCGGFSALIGAAS